jgi:L-amino acid N-acyltransferase YncA
MQIRLATLDDALAILEIYAHYCLMKPSTFELEPPSAIPGMM